MTDGNIKDDCEVSCVHKDAIEEAKKRSKDLEGGILTRLSDIFKTMGDPTRLKIINALSTGEMCVCDIASVLNMEHSAISHQLRILRAMKVVKFRKEGKSAFYSLDDEHVMILYTEGLKHARHG